MNEKVIIKKDDYERYTIPFSLNYFLPKARKKYIWEELEKQHPCFSEDCCYFYKDKIGKKGVFSDVIVMGKAKLAEYKGKCKKLYMEDKESKKFLPFSLFEKRGGKRIFLAVLLICCIVSVYVIAKSGKKINKENEYLEIVEENKIMEEGTGINIVEEQPIIEEVGTVNFLSNDCLAGQYKAESNVEVSYVDVKSKGGSAKNQANSFQHTVDKKINESDLNFINGKKIGEINYIDGKKVVFYKNNNGKIVKSEVINEENMLEN